MAGNKPKIFSIHSKMFHVEHLSCAEIINAYGWTGCGTFVMYREHETLLVDRQWNI